MERRGMWRLIFAATTTVFVGLMFVVPRMNFLPGIAHDSWKYSDAEARLVKDGSLPYGKGAFVRLIATGGDGVAAYYLAGTDMPEGDIIFSVYLRAASSEALQVNLFADERSFVTIPGAKPEWERVFVVAHHSWGRPIVVNIGGNRSFKAGDVVDVWGPQLNWGRDAGTSRDSAFSYNFGLGLIGGIPLWILSLSTIIGWALYEYVRRGNALTLPSKYLVVSLVVWFFVFDFAAAQLVPGDSPFRIPHHFFHHGISPSSRIIDKWGPLTTEIYTNDQGMKDASIRQVAQKYDGYRILVLGDSFTEGQGYRYEDTFSGVFQGLARKSGLNVEVLNGGVASHSPKLYYYHLKYLLDAARLHVDEVWAFVDVSDPQDEVSYRHFWPSQEDDAQYFARKLHAFMYHNSYVYASYLRRRFEVPVYSFLVDMVRWLNGKGMGEFKKREPAVLYTGLIKPSGVDAIATRLDGVFGREEVRQPWMHPEIWPKGGFMAERYGWYGDVEIRQRWADDGLALAEAYTRELVDLAKKRGIRIGVAIYPGARNVGTDSIGYEGGWRRLSASLGVPFVDVFDAFRLAANRGEDVQRGYFIPGDVHFNERGHRLVGEAWFASWCSLLTVPGRVGYCK